jgi:hypothetical protein
MKVFPTFAAILLLVTEFTAPLDKLNRDLGMMVSSPTATKIVLP